MSLFYFRQRLHAEIDIAGIVGHKTQNTLSVVGNGGETQRGSCAIFYLCVCALFVYLGQGIRNGSPFS